MPQHPAVAYLYLVRCMVAFLGLIILSIGAALVLEWFVVTRKVSRLRTVLLTLAALIVVSAICVIVGYFSLRVYINDHYEINIMMLIFFVLPPITAGVIADLLSTAMLKWFAIVVACAVIALAIAAYRLSIFWPAYDWVLRLPSPDGRYDLIVLRGDKAAFDDFFYHIYVFPHSSAPADRPKGTRVLYTYPWRGRRYLVYSGYATPLIRWTSPDSLAIDLNDLYNQYSVFESLKRFDARHSVTASLHVGHDDPADVLPDGSNLFR